MEFLTHRWDTHLDLHQVDWLHESVLGGELAGQQDSAGGGNDLATTTVDGICVQRHIMDVKADSSHVLLTQRTLQEEKGHYNTLDLDRILP